MSKEISFPDAAGSTVGSILADTYEKIEELEEAIKSVRGFRKIMHDLQKYISKQWPFHVLDLMDKQEAFIKAQCKSGPFPLPEIEYLREVAQEQAKKLRIWYPQILEEACKEADLPLDMSSRHPEYTFDEGFFELTIDQRTAVLSNSERKLAEFPADIEAVIEKVREEHKRIFARPYDGPSFLKKLREHYLGVVQRQGQDEGAGVPIRRIAGRMASEKKGYQTDQFIVDLSRLAREGPLEIDGKRLELQHTRNDKEGMLLHNVGTLSYVGFVSFEEVGS